MVIRAVRYFNAAPVSGRFEGGVGISGFGSVRIAVFVSAAAQSRRVVVGGLVIAPIMAIDDWELHYISLRIRLARHLI